MTTILHVAAGWANQPSLRFAVVSLCSCLPRPSPLAPASDRVIHLVLDRMRRHAEARDLLQLQLDVRIDEVVTEHAARLDEAAVLVQRLERHVQAVAYRRD